MQKLTLDLLLSRITTNLSFDEIAKDIESHFDLGNVLEITPLFAGYDDVNCLLKTDRKSYVVKIFASQKSLETIQKNVSGILSYLEHGIPTPQLYSTLTQEYIHELGTESSTYLIVMDYFEGRKFTEFEPEQKDFVELTQIVAKIHNLPIVELSPTYDMWLTVYLLQEFEQKSNLLDKEDYKLIKPIIDELKNISWKDLQKSMVHFDLHRENAMKSAEGDYVVLDLANYEYNYTVFDLATFIALFCLDFKKSFAENKEIYELVMNTYNQHGKLTSYEQEMLPLLVKATYAANLLITSYIQKTDEDDNPVQTEYYKLLAKAGLSALQDQTL